MKALFISTSYEQKNNSAAIRNNGWVEGLIENGIQVDVLTIDWPEFMQSEFLKQNNKATIIKNTLPELKALQYTKGSFISNGRISRIIKRIRFFIRDIIFFPDICRNWRKVINNIDISQYDVIVSSSDFKSSHFVASDLIKKTKKKWIQVWGDPWSTDINLSKNQKARVKKNEKRILNAADAIIYVSNITRHELQSLYPDLKDKMHYIPRGYYIEAPESNEDKRNEDYFKLVYTGVLSQGRNIGQLLKAILEFNSISSKKIQLTLYGNYGPENIELFKPYDFVTVHDSVDYSTILKVYSSADILLFVSNGISSTQIPGKFFDYMGARKPVLCLCSKKEEGLYSLLSNYDRCVLPTDDTFEGLLEILQSAVEKSSNHYLPCEEFSPKNIGAQLIEIINEC